MVDDSMDVNEVAKITSKLGDHEFRITKLEKQMEQATNNIHELTNSVKALTKIVREDHEKLKEVKEDIRDLKEAYKEANKVLEKNFTKLLNTLTNNVKRSQNRIDEWTDRLWKLLISILVVMLGLKFGGVI